MGESVALYFKTNTATGARVHLKLARYISTAQYFSWAEGCKINDQAAAVTTKNWPA